MSFSPMICEDCSYPPNWTVMDAPDRNGEKYCTTKCRDCGEEWEEPVEIFDRADVPDEDSTPSSDDPSPF